MTDNGCADFCAKNKCAGKCCTMQHDESYLMLFPDELKGLSANSISHLELIGSLAGGGCKARCKAEDRINCDGGYKPVQCRIYPFWMNEENRLLKSNNCPVKPASLIGFDKRVEQLLRIYPSLNTEFLSEEVNNYSPYIFEGCTVKTELVERGIVQIMELERKYLDTPSSCGCSDYSDLEACKGQVGNVLVWKDDQVIAFIIGRPIDYYKSWFNEKVFVHPDYRKQGLFWMMQGLNLKLCLEAGMKEITVTASPLNEASNHVFLTLGFKPIHTLTYNGNERTVYRYAVNN